MNLPTRRSSLQYPCTCLLCPPSGANSVLDVSFSSCIRFELLLSLHMTSAPKTYWMTIHFLSFLSGFLSIGMPGTILVKESKTRDLLAGKAYCRLASQIVCWARESYMSREGVKDWPAPALSISESWRLLHDLGKGRVDARPAGIFCFRAPRPLIPPGITLLDSPATDM